MNSHRKTLVALNERVIKSQIKSDVDKCKVMRVGKDNPSFTYKIMGSKLAISTWDQNPQVIIDNSMQMSAQDSVAIKKANAKQGIIRKGGESKTGKIVMLLYKSMDSLLLNAIVQSLFTDLKYDTEEIEKLQRKAIEDDQKHKRASIQGMTEKIKTFYLGGKND